MIDFGATLLAKLANTSTEANWVLKLFFNDHDVATNFIGVSGRTYKVGTTTYHGIVKTWGGLTQNANLVNFAVSQGTVMITLDNKEQAILGGRFSDFFATKNFVSRKWELYMECGGTLSTETIGQGLIGGNIPHDDLTVTMQLVHKKYSTQIPVNTVDVATFPDAPTKNIDAPIPIAYGDFSPSNADTTVNLDKKTVRGMAPAILTNRNNVDAKPDSQALNSLDNRLVAMKDEENYAFCLAANTTVNAATPLLTITGTDYRIPLTFTNMASNPGSASTNPDNAWDEDLTTIATLESNVAAQADHDFTVEPLSGSGVVQDIITSINNNAVTDPGVLASSFAKYAFDGAAVDGSGSDLLATGAITDDALSVNAANKEYPVAGAIIRIEQMGDVTKSIMPTKEFSAELKISPKQTFVQRSIKFERVQGTLGSNSQRAVITDNREYGANVTFNSNRAGGLGLTQSTINKLTKTYELNAPADLEYIYCSGQFRKFGSWISDGGRSVGYASGALIENPIYMVEEFIRTEGGITDIDTDAFDESGNTTNGFLGDVFNLAVASVLFAFSQKSFTTLEGLWNQIGSQCGTLFFPSGSGKIKAKTRRRKADYTTADFSAEYGHIDVGKSTKTPINDVRNSIQTKYALDYSLDDTTEITPVASDATSQGNTVDGYKEVLSYEDAIPFTADSATAIGGNSYTLDLRKDQARVFPFTSNRPIFQQLEVGDTMNFLDWPANFKVQGKAVISTDIWMVNSAVKKGPDSVNIQVEEVS